MIRENGGKISVAVSEPTWKNNGVLRIKIDKPALNVVSADSRITVVQMSPAIIIDVDLSGNPNGATFTAVFSS